MSPVTTRFGAAVQLCRRSPLLLLALLLLLGTGCSKKPTGPPDAGGLANGVYTNTFFNFKMTLPTRWYSLTKKGLAAKEAWSEEVFRSQQGGQPQSPAATPPAAPERTSYNLFMVSQLQPDTTGTFNPSLSCVAERVAHLSQPITAADFLARIKTILSESRSFTASFTGEPDVVALGGQNFSHLRANLTVGPMVITQEYYALAANGYILALVKSYQTQEQGAILEESLRSLRFL